jgi:hypothetical protein
MNNVQAAMRTLFVILFVTRRDLAVRLSQRIAGSAPRPAMISSGNRVICNVVDRLKGAS